MEQLKIEGLHQRSVFVGDVMLDAVNSFNSSTKIAEKLRDLQVAEGEYALATIHRAENTDDLDRLENILDAFKAIDTPIVFPMHPRLKHRLEQKQDTSLSEARHIHIIEPVGYFEMLSLQKQAKFIMTDSGGVQKEAYFVGVPCLTLRDETEWVETLHGGWNSLVGAEMQAIVSAAKNLTCTGREHPAEPRRLDGFGGGQAGERSVEQILKIMRAA